MWDDVDDDDNDDDKRYLGLSDFSTIVGNSKESRMRSLVLSL